jgi:hypothetical protein
MFGCWQLRRIYVRIQTSKIILEQVDAPVLVSPYIPIPTAFADVF